MKKIISILLVLTILLCMSISSVSAQSSIDGILSNMTTEQKIAQMIMPAFRTYNGNNVTQMNPKIQEIIEKYGFAGVILYAQNNASTEQTVRLIDSIQRVNASVEGRTQMLIAVDQEGAGVPRLAEGTQGPGNMAIGATSDSTNANEMGRIIGSELYSMGYNVDFAPVVDINNNPSNPVIGIRSFSDDANTVAEFGSNFMSGLMSKNIITSLKHYPGHGNTEIDSHTGLPRIEKTYDELKQNELIPFEKCINDGAEMIMTAHIQYPKIKTETYTSIKDGQTIELPATLSRTIITNILRNDLGYDGVVVTDAMEMGAIAKHFDKLDSAKLAINAGIDILLMPVDTSDDAGIDALDQYIVDVAEMVDNGEISIDNVNNAVTRILKLKENHGLLDKYDVQDLQSKIDIAKQEVGSKENHDKEWEIAKKSITLVKNDNNMLPIKENEKTVIMLPYANEVNSAEYAIERLKEEGIIDENMDVSAYLMAGKTLEEIQDAIKNAKNVIVVSEQYNAASLAGNSYTKLDSIIEYVHSNGNKIAFISCYLPYEVARLQSADSILIAWSAKGMNVKPDFTNSSVPTYGVSIPAGIYMAFGENTKVTGKLPINIPSLDDNYKYTNTYLYERGYGLEYEKVEKDYNLIAGGDQEVNIDKTSKLTFEFDISFNQFLREGRVYVDNELVESSNYTLFEGSTIITFNDEYTKKLSMGSHSIRFEVSDGSLETTFKIAKVETETAQTSDTSNENTTTKTGIRNPKTSDNIAIWIILMISTILALPLTFKLTKVKN